MYKILSLFFVISLSINGQILFSEYAEGSSYNKYLEIYNYSNEEVDLSGYAFPSCSNGCNQEGEWDYMNYFPDGDVINPGDVYVIAHPNAIDPSSQYYTEDIAIYSDYEFTFLSNGDDVFALINIETQQILDVIGAVGPDPGDGWDVAGVVNGTKDHTLLRKSSVSVGNGGGWINSAGTNTNDSEWIVLDNEVWENLGFHECDACGVTIIFGCTDSVALNYNPLATNDDGSCEYAEVEGCSDSTACNYNPAAASSYFSFSNTDSNMTIAIDFSVGSLIGLDIGDLIGVFYMNDSNELACAGTAVWNEETLAIAAWGSESGLDNGFIPAEEFTFMIQKLNGTIFLLEVSMSNDPPFSETFSANGFGQILDWSITEQYFDLENCDYPEEYYDCFGNCLNDSDDDGICDEFELGVEEDFFSSSKLIKTIDLLGREIDGLKTNNILYQIFENGVIIKKIIIH